MDHRANRLGAALTLLGTAVAAHAQTRVVYVDQTAPAGGDGASWQNAFNDLQAACEAINSGEAVQDMEVRIAQGTYRPSEPRMLNHAFVLRPTPASDSARLSVLGSFGGRQAASPDSRDPITTPTILSGDALGNDGAGPNDRDDNAPGVLDVTWGRDRFPMSLVIDRFIVRGGGGTFDSGPGAIALESDATTTQITNCVIEDNLVSGVAIFNSQADLTFIRDCRIRDNHWPGAGGAVCVYHNAIVFLTRCSLEGNSVSGDGGAVLIQGGGLFADECTFIGNSAGASGGAICSRVAQVGLSECLIAGNRAASLGGAVRSGLDCGIGHCTIVDNSSPWASAVMLVGRGYFSNTILFGNSGTSDDSQVAVIDGTLECHNVLVEQGRASIMAILNGTIIEGDGGIMDIDPGFVDRDGPDDNPMTVADNDYRLRPRSAAVDRGNVHLYVDATDLLGHPRAIAGVIGRTPLPDLGCYESQLTLCPSDMNADGGVTVDDLLAFIEAYAAGGWLADVTTDGTSPQPDGAVTIDDLLYFLARFEGGC